ncbi:MAG: Hsp70 family protein [Aureliella sp.]
MIIGIDLGTTNSVAAYMAATGPQLIPNALGRYLTPSVVGIDQGGNVVVGDAAREYQVVQPRNCASLFKRYMGTDRQIAIGGHAFTAEQLSSLILKSLKQDAEAFFGTPVHRAVITVPAYFNDNQRKATIAAGQMAGFEVMRILNEPTAAAMAYGMHNAQADRTLIVLDLGGGTFDVSVVEVFDGAIEVKASSGECFLGGEDFTVALASYLLKSRDMHFEKVELQQPRMVSRLIHQCEKAKQTLSTAEVATVRWPDEQGDFSPLSETVDVDISQFDLATKSILERVEQPIRRALGDANLRRGQIDQVLLVGGATRMRNFRSYIELIFNRVPKAQLNPDEVVAIGAAVQAGLIANDAAVDDLVVTDVCPFTLGVEICRRLGGELVDNYFLPIIDRNSTIPASRVKTVSTVSADQRSVSVNIYQGEGRKVKDNLLIGSFEASGIPLGPAGQEIDIRFTYDLNGVLEAEATILATGKKTSHVLTRYAKNLSEDQIRASIAQMQALKVHPRDQVVNQNALRRAERIYTELPVRMRDQLNELIDAFEDALLYQDNKLADAARRNLDAYVDMVERSGGDPGEAYAPW